MFHDLSVKLSVGLSKRKRREKLRWQVRQLLEQMHVTWHPAWPHCKTSRGRPGTELPPEGRSSRQGCSGNATPAALLLAGELLLYSLGPCLWKHHRALKCDPLPFALSYLGPTNGFPLPLGYSLNSHPYNPQRPDLLSCLLFISRISCWSYIPAEASTVSHLGFCICCPLSQERSQPSLLGPPLGSLLFNLQVST